MRTTCEIEEPSTVDLILLRRVLVRLDLLKNSTLVRTQASRLPLERVRVDQAVQLVVVHLVDTIVELRVLHLQTFDGVLVELALTGVGDTEGIDDQTHDVVVEGELAQDADELPLHLLLPHVPLRAFLLVVGAVVVDIAIFLQLPNKQAAAMSTVHQTREGELLLS